MFSHQDILTLQTFNLTFNLPNSSQNLNYQMPMHLLVTETATYAIVINNIDIFNEQMQEIINNQKALEKFKQNIEVKYSRFFNPNDFSWDEDQKEYEKVFLKFITGADDNS